MTRRIFFLAGLLAMRAAMPAATIGYWDFNSTPPDTSASTGTTAPVIGLGTATVVGGTTGSFAAGSPTDTAPDNTGWSTASYPSINAGNKTAGVQFQLSTRGYSNIVVAWDQRVSGSASRYARFQYSTDGAAFTDAAVIEMPSNNTFYARSVNLVGIVGTVNNPNFAFRIVAEFESSATGTGTNGYVTALGGNYSAAGTVRFDAVRITGVPMNPNNTPPVIEPIPDLVTMENHSIAEYSISVTDDTTPASDLVLRATSANTNVIPTSGLQLGGSGTARRLTISPLPDVFGQSLVTISASDAENLSSSRSFLVTVTPLNVPPTMSAIPHQRVVMGGDNAGVPFVITDVETPASALVVTTTSSNPALIEGPGLAVEGSGENRTLRLSPVTGQAGTALITLRVTDTGGRSAETSFVLSVVPTATTLLWENFGYSEGSLTLNSANFWQTHGGTTGQVHLTSGGITLASSQSEDLHFVLPGGAIETGFVYASLQLQFSALPSANEYFAHLNHASGFRARLFAGTNDAARGFFRLGIGNGGATGIGQVTRDLSLNTPYAAIVRYDVANATSALWVEATAETTPDAMATDSTTSVDIASFSLREASGIGAMRINNVRVGRSFADVVSVPPTFGPPLAIVELAREVEVSWPMESVAYRLQSNVGLRATDWIDEPVVPTEAGGRMIVRLTKTAGNRFFRLTR